MMVMRRCAHQLVVSQTLLLPNARVLLAASKIGSSAPEDTTTRPLLGSSHVAYISRLTGDSSSRWQQQHRGGGSEESWIRTPLLAAAGAALAATCLAGVRITAVAEAPSQQQKQQQSSIPLPAPDHEADAAAAAGVALRDMGLLSVAHKQRIFFKARK